MTHTYLGIDAGQRDRSELEHLLARAVHACGDAVPLACTHLVEDPQRHWAGSLELAGTGPDAEQLARVLDAAVTASATSVLSYGPPSWLVGSAAAALQLRERRAGRAVVFAGQQRLVGIIEADQVTALSAVTRLVGVADTPTTGVLLDTRDFVRPEIVEGELLLRVRPFGADGTVALTRFGRGSAARRGRAGVLRR